MSRKNYVKMAGILAGDFACADAKGKAAIFRVTLSLADYFQSDNPRFDRSKFYTAVFGTDNLDTLRAYCTVAETLSYS
jgi:hypothetical protein